MKTNWRFLAVVLFCVACARAEELKTQNVVLITSDGLRWQEVFTGAEEALISKKPGGVANVDEIRADYWRDTPDARRTALMPFMWNMIGKHGQIYGNQGLGSVAAITNTMKFSYPGYNEILCGFADPKINSNDKILNTNVTVLEWLNRRPGLGGRVAAFSNWTAMSFIINEPRAGLPVVCGSGPIPDKDPNPRQQLLNELMADSTRPNPNELHDAFVFQAAREHLLKHKPRALYVAFGETDSWAHAGRYDLLLKTANRVDDYIRRLWEAAQSLDEYRGKTTFIISTDHGRGSGSENWKHHSSDTDGAENIWIAVIGPDTPPLGERKNCEKITQNQLAATMAKFLKQNYHATQPKSGAPIEGVFEQAK